MISLRRRRPVGAARPSQSRCLKRYGEGEERTMSGSANANVNASSSRSRNWQRSYLLLLPSPPLRPPPLEVLSGMWATSNQSASSTARALPLLASRACFPYAKAKLSYGISPDSDTTEMRWLEPSGRCASLVLCLTCCSLFTTVSKTQRIYRASDLCALSTKCVRSTSSNNNNETSRQTL